MAPRGLQAGCLKPDGRAASWLAFALVQTASLTAAAQHAESTALVSESQVGDAQRRDPESTERGTGDDRFSDEVVPTGLRSARRAALRRKRQSPVQLDAVVLPNIGDFPDLNLAESLQRLPGVAITRQNGEGHRIVLRGLPGLYARTRVNGMDARASLGDSRSRSFDFNLFAPELFRSVVVHKTASAELGEGSLGAVVDLNTGSAFHRKEGWTLVGGAHGSYNDLSEAIRPRVSALLAYRDPEGRWGATASAAYERVRNDTAVRDTGGWQKAPFGLVNGSECESGIGDGSLGCSEVADAFHPRTPRYGYSAVGGERLGLSGSLELRPRAGTRLRLDALYASYDFQSDVEQLGVLLRGNESGARVTDYSIVPQPRRFDAGNNTLSALSLDGALLRSEAIRRETENRFRQLTLRADHDFSGDWSATFLAGTSRSTNREPRSVSVAYDNSNYDGYRYDFQESDELPQFRYEGSSVRDPATFLLTQYSDRPQATQSRFDVLKLEAQWAPLDALKVTGGASYRADTMDTRASLVVLNVCDSLGNCDLDGDGLNDRFGAPPDQAELSRVAEFRGRLGTGSPQQWATPSIDNWANELGAADQEAVPNLDSTYGVEEEMLAFFLQTDGDARLGAGDARLVYRVGARYVETRQTSEGFLSGVAAAVERPTYANFLPSASVALWLNRALVTRIAAARVIARPALDLIIPSGSADFFNFQISSQNPAYEPTRATALDLSAEWYVAEASILSIAAFSKKLDSFPVLETRAGTFAETQLPQSLVPEDSIAGQAAEGFCGDPTGCWSLTQPVNGPGSTIKGLELEVQAPFTSLFGALPPVIEHMGFAANYSYLNSEFDYIFRQNEVPERLLGVSKSTYNAALFYEHAGFAARVSAATRGDYLERGPNVNANLWQAVDKNTRVDFWSRFRVSQHVRLNFQVQNLTNAPLSSYVDTDAQRRLRYDRYGRTLRVGASVSLPGG